MLDQKDKEVLDIIARAKRKAKSTLEKIEADKQSAKQKLACY